MQDSSYILLCAYILYFMFLISVLFFSMYRSMPDVEALMQEWPNQFEQLLATVGMPSAELDCNLSEYVDIICGK